MPITISTATQGPAKRQIIELAFSEIGAAGYEFGRTADEVRDAQLRLNAMMAEWKTLRGIDLGYIQPDYGVGNSDTLSGIPFEAMNTVASFLALRICPMMGAQLSIEAKGNLTRSLILLESAYATVPTMPIAPDTPRGIGREHRRGPFPDPFINEDSTDVNPTPDTAA